MSGYIISEKDYINVIEHEIKSFDILRKTDLNIFIIEDGKVLYKNNIINNASKNGHVQVLEWFIHSGYEFKYDKWAINYASIYGRVQVLEWYKRSKYYFDYDENAIIYASRYGHVQVLEWFKHSGYEFKYGKCAINSASEYGNVQVLEWFKHSGYEFKYDKKTIIYAKNTIVSIWFVENINPKKVIKWSKQKNINILRFKAKKRYFKGYKKN